MAHTYSYLEYMSGPQVCCRVQLAAQQVCDCQLSGPHGLGRQHGGQALIHDKFKAKQIIKKKLVLFIYTICRVCTKEYIQCPRIKLAALFSLIAAALVVGTT